MPAQRHDIKMSPEFKEQIAEFARRSGQSESAVARAALERYARGKPRTLDPTPPPDVARLKVYVDEEVWRRAEKRAMAEDLYVSDALREFITADIAAFVEK